MVHTASGTRAALPGTLQIAMGGPGPLLNERQLTSAIKNATNAERLLQLACSHRGCINAIHVAAILTKLANITKAHPSLYHQGVLGQPPHSSAAAAAAAAATFSGPDGSSSSIAAQVEAGDALVAQLQSLLIAQRCHGHSPRGLANIIWALGKMHNAPDAELMLMLLRRFFGTLPSAVPQDIANVLWGVAQVTRDHGLICPPGLHEKVAADDAAAGMAMVRGSAQQQQQQQQGSVLGPAAGAAAAADGCAGEACGVSSSTAGCPAAAEPGASSKQQQQQGSAMLPLLSVQQVQELLQKLCAMLLQAAPQTISNITCALCVLQHCHGWCMCQCLPQVQQLVTAFVQNIHESLPSHIHKVVTCLTQMATACASHAGDAWIVWQPPLLQVMLSHLAMQRRTLKQFHIISVLRDVTQLACLFLPLEVTSEVAATSAAAAAAAAAVQAGGRQGAGDTGASAAAAAGGSSSSSEEARKWVVLALAAAAAAVDEVLDVKALEDMEDDSGLPSSSAPLAAAAAAAAAARARAAAAAAGAADATASPSTPPLPGSGAPSSSSSSSGMEGVLEAGSPSAAYVRSLVAGMFARLTVADDDDAQPAGATAAAGGSAASKEAAAGTPGSLTAAAAADKPAAAAAAGPAAAPGSSSSSQSVLEKLLPQLERLGLLQQYNALRNCANSQGLMGGNLLGRQYTQNANAGGSRPGQYGGEAGFLASDMVAEAHLARQQALSWQQQQYGGGAMQQQQQRWWDNRQQQQQQQQESYSVRGDGGLYGGPGRRRVDVMGQVMEAGVYGGSGSPTAYGQGMPPGRVFIPGPHNSNSNQQQQMQIQGGPQPPPPPPQQHYQQQQQQQQMGPRAGEFMTATEAPSADISMISPFQHTASAAAAAAAAAAAPPASGGSLSKPLGGVLGAHGSSASSSVSAVPSHLMQLSSRSSNSSSYVGLGQAGSGLSGSVSSLQPGMSGSAEGRSGYGLMSSHSSGEARMRLRLPAQMSAPKAQITLGGHGSFSGGMGSSSSSAGGPAAAALPGPSGSGPAQFGGVAGGTAASSSRQWQMMQQQQQQHMPGGLQTSMAGSAGLIQQQQQQQQGMSGLPNRSSSTQISMSMQQGGFAGRAGTPGGQAVAYAETMGVLSPENSSSQVSGLSPEVSVHSVGEPPGLLGSTTSASQLAGMTQQQQQQLAARVADASIMFLTVNGQQVAYHSLPDGTLVPVQQQQQQQQQMMMMMTMSSSFTGAVRSPTVMQAQQQQQPQQQQAQMLQMLQQQQLQQQQQQLQQQQQQVLAVQNSVPAAIAFDMTASGGAAAMAAAQQQQQQQAGRQQPMQVFQLQQSQQQPQVEAGQVVYYVPAGNASVGGDGLAPAGSSVVLSGAVHAEQGGYVLVDSGSAFVSSEGAAGFNMMNAQGQMLLSPQVLQQQQQQQAQQLQQQQQLQLQQQYMQQQLAGPGSSTAMLHLSGTGGGNLGMPGAAAQDAATAQLLSSLQQQQQQQQVFYMLPQQGFQG